MVNELPRVIGVDLGKDTSYTVIGLPEHLWGFGRADMGSQWHIVPPEEGLRKGGTPPLCKRAQRRSLVFGRGTVVEHDVCPGCLAAWRKR